MKSMHQDLDCIDCHEDADVEDFPHEDSLEKVHCGLCHDDAQLDFDASVHGQALNRKAPYAPDCKDCHGAHDILPPGDPDSRTYKMNVPYLCGRCHREGAPVASTYSISEHNIVENYSQSIHGEGLFKRGLTVTATCKDCHRSHLILPHTEPRSSIAPRNIAGTCMQCHSRIEDVHDKIIRGELWESVLFVVSGRDDGEQARAASTTESILRWRGHVVSGGREISPRMIESPTRERQYRGRSALEASAR